jgi:glutaminyl-tRNA synthetase
MSAPKPSTPPASTPKIEAVKPSNFLRGIIERDLASGTYAGRRFAGTPGDAAHQAAGPFDLARVRTRFPPEPNGYLHLGHAKSICINFGLAAEYGGICHMRFDDTNPEKEEQEYVDSILDAIHWLGFGWETAGRSHLYFASDYFDAMYRAAEHLIQAGLAYVDEQSAEQIRAHRGDFGTPGTDSPFRDRCAADNLARFREMRDGRHPDGAMVLRAKIDMASPNINLRDPALYRIKHAEHHRTGNRWCIYPMYTFAHPIEDALEQVTHSICTLEFEDQRPFYDWLLERLTEPGTAADGSALPALFAPPLPRQYEFARLNTTYVITSKRKLKQLVDERIVSGWDDPRMPTLVGLRRRGYTPQALQLFCERTGVSKAGGWVDYASLEIALRDDLDPKAARAMAVLDPLKLVLTNWAEVIGMDAANPAVPRYEPCQAPVHPAQPERGLRQFSLGPEVWIEREDFMEEPLKGYHRLSPPRFDGAIGQGVTVPGTMVRLKYGYIIQCTGLKKNFDGSVAEVHAKLVPDTKSGTPGADKVKVKGTLTWVGAQPPEHGGGLPAEVRLYDRLFTEPQPDAGGKDFLASLNPASRQVVSAYLEPSLATAQPEARFQFERHGYFVADRIDHAAERPVFNRTTTLKDTWAAGK